MVEVREGLGEGDEVVLNPKVLLGDKAKTRDGAAPSPGGRRSRGKGGGRKGGGEEKKGGGGRRTRAAAARRRRSPSSR